MLLDENNDEPICLYDAMGEPVEFDQVAVIPYDEDRLYCILKPITPMPGVADDEAVVFAVIEEENGEIVLAICDDDEIAEEIFERYYKLLDEKQ